MITCDLRGGLGNQLFEIITTLSYAIDYNHLFYFENTYTLNNGVTQRHTYWNSLLIFLKKHLTETTYINKLTVVKEKSFNYEELPLITPLDNIILEGFFQSHKYFEKNFRKIYDYLQFEVLKKKATSKYNYDYKEFISMHFRHGDYKHLQDFHPILNYKYYENSLKEILKKTNNKFQKILFFCEKEDNEEIEQIIDTLKKKITNCVFIKVIDEIEDWQQLLLMSACSHNIIANSTFSWWGAYLNTNPTKIVCYPEVWFGPKLTHDTSDLFPESWTKISCV
jgi:hypothetical protein|uniref:Alpha-1,2-fucosyltransferase n=1 Tax=viral metagenome TaxID=1070528 RepID=A0A6C0CTX2_9ZZZZ